MSVRWFIRLILRTAKQSPKGTERETYPRQPRIVCTPTHRERLGNLVYRGTCSDANQRTRIQRFLDHTTGNEEYVLVPEGNIVSLAAQQFLHIYRLLLKPILSAMKQ